MLGRSFTQYKDGVIGASNMVKVDESLITGQKNVDAVGGKATSAVLLSQGCTWSAVETSIKTLDQRSLQ